MKLVRTAINIILLAVAANATWHFYQAYAAHYKLRDAARAIAQNRGDKTDAQIHDEIMAAAADADVPVDPDALVVDHAGTATSVTARYNRPIDLVPSHPVEWSFSFRVDTFARQAPNTVKTP